MNTRSLQRMEERTRASDRREEEARISNQEDTIAIPSLAVKLNSDLGKLPAAIVIEFENEAVAINLIHRRLAKPEANFAVVPDLFVSDDQLIHTGLPTELIPLVAAMLDTALEAA